ncbi:MAG: SUMF1/EgtB/PvdO family nonheme iron enzyme [Nitrospirota bacterium]
MLNHASSECQAFHTCLGLSLCVLLLPAVLFPHTLWAQDIARLQSGVVKITAKPPEGTTNVGTGFIVRVDKEAAYIITAAHVVAGDTQPQVEFFTKRNMPVKAEVLGLEGDDEVRGLALVVVRGTENLPKGITALSLAAATRLSGGEDILVIGFPGNAGPWALIKGNISSRQGRDIYFSPSVDSGHSGGPVLHSGNVVAMVGAGSQTVGRGVTARSVQDYIEGFGIMSQENTTSTSIATESSPSPVATAKPEPRPMTQDREVTGKDGAPMVLIPAGSFKMGSTKDEVDQAIRGCVKELEKNEQTCKDWYTPELPQHNVQIDAFYFDKYEVTNRLFQQFVQQTGHRTTAEREGSAKAFVEGKGWEEVKGASWQKPEAGATVFNSDRAEHPVVSVSWEDAQAYCRWAGKRLPTEAGFEYAARAGTTTKYWWGHGNPGARRVENLADESAKKILKGIMTGYDDGTERTAPVGSYEANLWGLHDISGNVAEWTADWYDGSYYGKSPPRNPKGPSSGEYRVFRGGSWDLEPFPVRSALRLRDSPSNRGGPIGFRCAQDRPK